MWMLNVFNVRTVGAVECIWMSLMNILKQAWTKYSYQLKGLKSNIKSNTDQGKLSQKCPIYWLSAPLLPHWFHSPPHCICSAWPLCGRSPGAPGRASDEKAELCRAAGAETSYDVWRRSHLLVTRVRTAGSRSDNNLELRHSLSTFFITEPRTLTHW